MSTISLSQKTRSFVGVTGANLVNNVISFAVTVVAARTIGPDQFGKLSLAVSIVSVLSSLLDFGLSTTLVRLWNTGDDPGSRRRLVTALVRWKICMLFLLVPASYVLRWCIVRAIPVLADAGGLVQTAVLASGLVSLWTTIRAVDQASSDFRSMSWFTSAYGLLRLVCCLALLGFGWDNLLNFFLVLYPVPLAALCLLNGYMRKVQLAQPNTMAELRADLHVVSKTLGYSSWVAVADIMYSILFRIAQFTLARDGAGVEVGLYGAALTFVTVFTLLNDAMRTIVLPEVSSLRDGASRTQFRERLVRMAPLFFSGMFGLLVISALIQFWLLGREYRESTPVFLVLGTAVVITIYLGIINTLVHSLGTPHLNAFVNMGRVAAGAALMAIVPKTAMNTALALGVVLIIGEYILYRLIRQRNEGAAKAGSVGQCPPIP